MPRSLANRDTVRCEFAFDIYRHTKGYENKGVSCEFEFQTANFDDSDKDSYNADHNRWTERSRSPARHRRLAGRYRIAWRLGQAALRADIKDLVDKNAPA